MRILAQRGELDIEKVTSLYYKIIRYFNSSWYNLFPYSFINVSFIVCLKMAYTSLKINYLKGRN